MLGGACGGTVLSAINLQIGRLRVRAQVPLVMAILKWTTSPAVDGLTRITTTNTRSGSVELRQAHTTQKMLEVAKCSLLKMISDFRTNPMYFKLDSLKETRPINLWSQPKPEHHCIGTDGAVAKKTVYKRHQFASGYLARSCVYTCFQLRSSLVFKGRSRERRTLWIAIFPITQKQVRSNKDASKGRIFKKIVLNCFELF